MLIYQSAVMTKALLPICPESRHPITMRWAAWTLGPSHITAPFDLSLTNLDRGDKPTEINVLEIKTGSILMALCNAVFSIYV
jgi:hypothetical protein